MYAVNTMKCAGFCALMFVLTLESGCTSPEIDRPGVQSDGSILLPNNWTLTPAGQQISVGDLPLAMAVTPDDAFLLVTNNGYADQYVSVIDVSQAREISKIPMQESWLGLTFNRDGDRLFVSGGGTDEIKIYAFDKGSAAHERTLKVKADDDKQPYFVSGLAVHGQTLLACAMRQNKLVVFDLDSDAAPTYIHVGEYPYTVVVEENSQRAYVSNWGGKSISVVDLNERRETGKIAVGDHPNAMVLSPGGKRLYVTSANSNELSILDTASGRLDQVLDLSPYPGAPASGSTPNGVTLSSDGKTLYLASADNNSVSVVDVSGNKAEILGSIPTGWYPTAVNLTSDDQTLFVANGKGLSSRPNSKGPQPTVTQPSMEYIGQLFLGTVSVLDVPDPQQLAVYTQQVSSNNGFGDMQEKLQRGAATVAPRAIPRRLGEPSLIKYVFYILKENRTYDQVLGDLPQGEGDPNLTIFGRDVSPNHHALAEAFVLFDNFYVDAEVSMDGHSWSMGAIATDFMEKTWPTNYSGRNFPAPIYLTVSHPTMGFLWDFASRAGISYRSYGEFVTAGENGSFSRLPALAGHVSTKYPAMDLSVRDNTRADVFIEELAQQIKDDSVPQLNIFSLPGDHTMGTRPGALTPRAMMADNDLALGRMVGAIAASSIWKESVVFIVQDDSQNGPDHIDAHRTVALIASPYAKRGYVDHTMYDTVSLLRTIELILGLPPMSQYDAAAVPMFDAFTDKADLAPYKTVASTYPLDEINGADAYGAELSMRMNFAEMDAAPELLLNEIIWKSIRGADSEMPRPHTNRDWLEDDEEEMGGM
jgi:YVTN family beta-propeller protein